MKFKDKEGLLICYYWTDCSMRKRLFELKGSFYWPECTLEASLKETDYQILIIQWANQQLGVSGCCIWTGLLLTNTVLFTTSRTDDANRKKCTHSYTHTYSQNHTRVSMSDQVMHCLLYSSLVPHLLPDFFIFVLGSQGISLLFLQVLSHNVSLSSSVIKTHIVRRSLLGLMDTHVRQKSRESGCQPQSVWEISYLKSLHTVSWWSQPKAAAFSSARKFKASASFIGSLLAISTAWMNSMVWRGWA